MKFKTTGKSLLELREEYGIGKAGFYDNDWWLKQSFAAEKPKAGIYELNLSNELTSIAYSEQKAKLGKGWEVPHPAIVVEAILSHYKKTGKRLCENYYLRTSAVDSDGYRVNVGVFDSSGLSVDRGWDVSRHDDLGLSSARKLKIEPQNLESFDASDEVYISGETVRELLERFRDNGAIGLVDIKVKAFVPAKLDELEKAVRVED